MAYRAILDSQPSNARAIHLLGMLARQTGRSREAHALLVRAIDLMPEVAAFHNNLAGLLGDMGNHSSALESARHALQLKPNYVEAMLNLSVALDHLDRYREAAEILTTAARLSPADARVYTKLGIALRKDWRPYQSLNACEMAVRLDPRCTDARNACGTALLELNRVSEAAAHFKRAIELQASHREAAVNLAMCTLTRGELAEGFRLFECRLQHPVWRRTMPGRKWDGSDPRGKTVLVYTEGGLGNTLQFYRFVPVLRSRGARVILECQPQLRGLLADAPNAPVLVGHGEPLPPYDAYLPMMSLPTAVGVLPDATVLRVPYITPQPRWMDKWKRHLCHVPGHRVGVCWQGDQQIVFRRNRSFPAEHLAKLISVPGTKLVSLQIGATVPRNLPLLELPDLDKEGAFLDTAAVMKQLDLVITCDTSIAHLAGSVGVPVWVVLPFGADWRWMLDRGDSPWYPTMRLFRQSSPGDWGALFDRMGQELALQRQAAQVGCGRQKV